MGGDLRLQIEVKFLVNHGFAQAGLQTYALLGLPRNLGIKHHYPIAASALGFKHGTLGLLDYFGCGDHEFIGVLIQQADTHTSGDYDFIILGKKWPGYGTANFIGQGQGHIFGFF